MGCDMKKLIVVLSILALSVSANADFLCGWDVTGINASTTPVFTNTVSGANIASNSCVLSLGSGVADSGTANTFGGLNFNEVSLANAIAANDYFSWVVQADEGYQVSITNISWNFTRTGTGGSNLVLRSSFDGYTADLYTLNDFLITSPYGDANFATSLSGSNRVEFRLYVWSATDSGGVDRFRNLAGSDLLVEGTATVIPEPGSLALMGLGLLGVAILRLRIG